MNFVRYHFVDSTSTLTLTYQYLYYFTIVMETIAVLGDFLKKKKISEPESTTSFVVFTELLYTICL